MKSLSLLLLSFLLLPLTSHGINPGPEEPTPGDPGTPGLCADDNLQPGQHQRSLTIDGQRRQYILHVPRSYTGDREVPLLLDFHALHTSSGYQLDNSGTQQVANQQNIIVAYPQGIDNAWNLGPCCTESRTVNDVGFAREIVEQVSAEACVDRKRVYATGYSNGGGMAYILACRAADMFAAVAPAAFDMISEVQCNPSRPISVFAHRGRLDAIVPYRGGPSTPPTGYDLDPITFLGAEGSFERWSDLNSCGGSSSIGNNCVASGNCAGGVENVLCTARLGSHSPWDAQTSWDFLKQHSLP